MSESKLENQIKLGSHLGAMTADGMLVSSLNVFDENREQSLQSTIDNVYSKTEVEDKITEKIAQAKLDGSDVDLSAYATKTELNGKADTVHKHKSSDITDLDLTPYAKSSEVEATYQPKGNYLTSIPSEYITETKLADKGYLTEHQDISGKADLTDVYTKTQADAKFLTSHQSLEGKADKVHSHTIQDITDLDVDEIGKVRDVKVGNVSVLGEDGVANITLPQAPDLTPYVTKTELNGKGYLTSIPAEYITETELSNKGFLTQHQDISGKADKTELFSGSYNDLTDKPTIPSLSGLITETKADGKYQAKGSYAASVHTHVTTDIEGFPAGNIATESYVQSQIAQAKLDGSDVDLSAFLTKDNATQLYQPKGTYLTEHQSLDGKADLEHTHTKSEITDLDLSVYGKVKDVKVDNVSVVSTSSGIASISLTSYAKSADVAETYQVKGNYLTQHQDISGKANKVHTHVISDITDLDVNEIGKVKDVKVNGSSVVVSGEAIITVPSLTGYAKTADIAKAYQPIGNYLTATDIEGKSDEGHTHTSSDITDLTAVLAPYAKTANVQAKGDYATNTALNNGLSTKADESHSHVSADITDLTSKLSSYAKTADVEKKYQVKGDYLTEVPAEYITEEELEGMGYLTESNLSPYAKSADVYSKTTADSTFQKKGSYVTPTELAGKGYLVSADIEEKVDRSELSGYSTTDHTHSASEITGLEIKVKDVKVGTTSVVDSKGVANISLSGLATTSELSSAIQDLEAKDVELAENITNSASSTLASAKAYADSVASGAMKWKGVKATKSELPENAKVGDFWTVTGENNSEFAWNGTDWICIGADVDFSQVNSDISELQTAVAGKANLLHTHKSVDIPDLSTVLEPYAKTTDLSGYQPAGDYLTEIPGTVMKTDKTCTITVSHTYSYSPSMTSTSLASSRSSEIKAGSLYLTTGNAVAGWWETEKANYLTSQDIEGKANADDVYTKTETDELLEDKATVSALNLKADKTTLTTELAKKANSADVYTQTEVDGLLADKADSTELTSSLALKANASTTYTKTEVDNKLKTKANSSDIPDISGLATKLELADKADSADVYTKTETDELLSAKASTTDLTTELAKKAGVGDSYTKSEEEDLLAAKVDTTTYTTGLAAKADSSTVYTKTVADSKFQPKGSYLVAADIADKADRSELFSGSYEDLENKPEIPSITGLITEDSATQKFQAKGDYVTTSALTAKGYITSAALTPYVTSEALEEKGYLVSTDISGKADSENVYSKEEADSTFLTILDFHEMTEAEILAICK